MLSENRRKIIAEDEAWSDEIPCAIDEETTAIDGSNGIYQKIMNRIFKVKNLLYNRRIITGSGMTGGGNLSTDVNLDVKRTSDPTGIATDTCLTQSGGKTIWDKALEVLGLTNTNKAAILNNKEQIENLYGNSLISTFTVPAHSTIQKNWKGGPGTLLVSCVHNGTAGVSLYMLTGDAGYYRVTPLTTTSNFEITVGANNDIFNFISKAQHSFQISLLNIKGNQYRNADSII